MTLCVLAFTTRQSATAAVATKRSCSGARGITAHLIAPGPADTERLRRVAADRAALNHSTVEAVLDAMRAESSHHMFTEPGQVAWAVETLLAPRPGR